MRAYDIIKKKRDKKTLTKEEIDYFISGYVNGDIPDYQASALLMAIYLNGMDDSETSLLTLSMAQSGDQLDLSSIEGIKVDKHSTGGVGDKTTLIIAPILAACGVPFAKMSGRGLGHTGGTIDKLESIPGFKTDLSINKFLNNVNEFKLSIAGQTGNMVPADKKLYSLRDVTATISSLPLIASSIMSKKIAAGADKIVLDVKTGSGAFMKTYEDSLNLAKKMVTIGENTGRETIALITNMDQPLGNAIGNALEVKEVIQSLNGKGPRDLQNICIKLSVLMVRLSLGITEIEAKKLVLEALSKKTALAKFKTLLVAQGGDAKILEDESLLPESEIKYNYYATEDGYISAMTADKIGIASMILGAGRETKEDKIDYGAGIYLHKKVGDNVRKGDLIASMYTNDKSKIEEARKLLDFAISYTEGHIEPLDMVYALVDKNGVHNY